MMKKRVLSMLMSVVMLLSMLPVNALSVGEEQQPGEELSVTLEQPADGEALPHDHGEQQETELPVTPEEPADGGDAAPADDGAAPGDAAPADEETDSGVQLLGDTVTVSGTVVFPHALDYEISVFVDIETNMDGYQWTEVTVPAGATQVNYSFQITRGAVIYSLSAQQWDGEDLYSMAYVTADGTCSPFHEECDLSADGDVTQDITFGSGVRIGVEVSMPAGVSCDEWAGATLHYSGRDDTGEHRSGVYSCDFEPNATTTSAYIVAPEGFVIERLELELDDLKWRPESLHSLMDSVYYDAEKDCSTPYWQELELTVQEGLGPFHMQLMEGVRVSGTVSLPGGVTYDDYVRGDLYFWAEEGNISTWFGIEPGEPSADYSVCLPADMTVREVRMYLYDMPADAGLLEQMYYNGQTWVTEYVSDLDLKPQALGRLDVPLQAGRVITGTVSLPDGVALTEPLRYSIGARVTVNGSRKNYWMNGTLQPGETSASYALTVPANAETLEELRLMVESDSDELLQNAYYDGQGGMSPMRQTLSVSLTDGADIDLFFLPVGSTISGTVSLPESFVYDDTRNIRVYVSAQYGDKNEEDSVGVDVLLGPEQRSAAYALPLPGGEEYTLTAMNTYVHFDGSDDDVPGLISEYTYDLTALTGQSQLPLDRDWTGMNLTLPAAASISGTLSFAPEAYADGGMEAQISLRPTGGGRTLYTSVDIPNGGLAEKYPWTVSVPEGKETYTLAVQLYSGKELVEDTNLLLYTKYYYGADGLTAKQSGAAPVKAGDSLDLTMPIPVMTSLALTFADNVVMDGSYELNFMVYDETHGHYVLDEYVTVENTAPLTFSFPADKLSEDHKYSVRVSLSGEGETNLRTGQRLYWTGSGFDSYYDNLVQLTAETLQNGLTVTLSGVEMVPLTLTFADNVIMTARMS